MDSVVPIDGCLDTVFLFVLNDMKFIEDNHGCGDEFLCVPLLCV